MPSQLYRKIRRHIENNQQTESQRSGQEQLLKDLPQSLASQVLEITHGQIIEKILFLQNRHQDFLFVVMPELKPLKLLKSDTLYQERDHAEELYFIKQGKIKLHVDVGQWFAEDNPEDEEEEEDEEAELARVKNVAFIAYTEGSHFGDVDILGNEKFHSRDSTAIATDECHFFVLSLDSIKSLKRNHREVIDEMTQLATRRRQIHRQMIEQLREKVTRIRQ